MAIPRKLLVVLVPLILGFAVACGGSKSSPTATTASSSGGGEQPAATATTSSSSSNNGSNGGSSASSDVVVKVMSNFINAKSWSAQISDSSDPTSNGTFEYVAPDKYHISIAGTELIAIGNDTYINAGGSWIKSTSSGSSGPLFDPSQFQDTIKAAQQAQVTKGDTDTVNGTKCQIYTYHDSASATDVHICVANDLPVRVVEDNGDSTSTIIFSDFNSSKIDIKAPI